MKRFTLLALMGIAVIMVPSVFAAPTPCGSSANGTLAVYSTGNNVYCINSFGWSDTWLVGNPTGPLYDPGTSPQFDILSGDDAPWVQSVNGATTTGSWVSPTLDEGTLNAQPVTNSGVDGNGWQVVTNTTYTANAAAICGAATCQAQSVIEDVNGGNGLGLTITTTVGATSLTIDYSFTQIGTATFADIQMMDYFNAHPAGSTGSGRLCGMTSYNAGQIFTNNVCGLPIVNDAFMSGSRVPAQGEVGYAAAAFGMPVVWQDVQTGALPGGPGPLGASDTAGALLWNLGPVDGRGGQDLVISKGFDINIGTPEPGTLLMGIGAGLLLLGLRRKRA